MRDFRNYTWQDENGFEMINMVAPEGMIVQLWFTSLPWGNETFGPGRFGRVNLYLSDTGSRQHVRVADHEHQSNHHDGQQDPAEAPEEIRADYGPERS